MPLLHCKKCQHEWEGRADSICDWCGASGRILEEETQFERWAKDYVNNPSKWKKVYSAKVH